MAIVSRPWCAALAASAFVTLTATAGWGAEPVQLDEVVVHGETEFAVPAGQDATVSTVTITLDDYRDRFTSVAELLDQVAGVRIQRFGGLDQFATVMIRGSSAEQVQVYLDGIPLNQAAGGPVNLGLIPIESIKTITVYRGQAPARYATSAIGGVIAIETSDHQEGRESQLTQRYGSLNTYTGLIKHRENVGPNDLAVSYQFSRSDGNFTFTDDGGTPGNPDDDTRTPRRNNEFAQHNFLARWTRELSRNFSLTLYNNFFYEERGVPGLGTLKSDTAHLGTIRNLARLSCNWAPLGLKAVTLEAVPFFSATKTQFEDLNGEIGLGRQDNDDDTFFYGSDFRLTAPLGRHQRLTGLLAYHGEQYRPENKIGVTRTGIPSYRHRVAIALEDEIYLWQDRLVVNPLFRTELIFNRLSGEDPSLAASGATRHASQFPVSGKLGARLQLPEQLTLRGSVGRAFRVPDFSELFGDHGAIVGNPDLKPEESLSFDLGLEWQIPHYRVSALYYENHTKNLIQFLQTSQFTARATNLARATIRGIEIEATAKPWAWWTLEANYTLQLATDSSGRNGFDGKFLPGRPQHQWHAGTEFTAAWFRGYAALDYINGNFLDAFNALEVKHRTLVTLGTSIAPLAWLNLGIEVKNLLGEQIVDAVGFPVPGRLIFGNMTITI